MPIGSTHLTLFALFLLLANIPAALICTVLYSLLPANLPAAVIQVVLLLPFTAYSLTICVQLYMIRNGLDIAQ